MRLPPGSGGGHRDVLSIAFQNGATQVARCLLLMGGQGMKGPLQETAPPPGQPFAVLLGERAFRREIRRQTAHAGIVACMVPEEIQGAAFRTAFRR